MKKYDLSKIMKRAWGLVKKEAMSISGALQKAWREAKEDIVETLKKNLEDMAYGCRYINLGINRVVSAKLWEKNGSKRTYLDINCYTLNGRYKGQYRAGYVDMLTKQYVATRYDDIDAQNKEYLK